MEPTVPAELKSSSATHSAVLEVVGAVPHWWEQRARAAGLSDPWCDWTRALAAPPVKLVESAGAEHHRATPFELGEAYVLALHPDERLQHGRHYTPRRLAEALWLEIAQADAAIERTAPVA